MKLVVFYLGITLTFCAKLPKHFRKCDQKQPDFQKCLPLAVQEAMSSLNSPIPELGLPSLNPLEVPSMTISAGTSAVGLQQNFKNVKIYGVNHLECTQMDVNFEKKTIDNRCFYPEIRMEAQYDINGKVLLLDIHGHGASTVTLSNVTITVHYNIEEYQKKSRKYLNITKLDLKLNPGKMQLNFENLFDGDKNLSENVHQVVNENWREVYEDVRASYDEVFGRITLGIFNSLLKKVPVDELFGK